MPQSLSCAYMHIVFSAKDRVSYIDPSQRGDLHTFMAGIARQAGCICYAVGGTSDHVHIVLALSRTLTIAQLVSELKTASAKWLKSRDHGLGLYSWQRGYAAFSFGLPEKAEVVNYVLGQEKHHVKRSFTEEYLSLLKANGVEYDERYVFD